MSSGIRRRIICAVNIGRGQGCRCGGGRFGGCGRVNDGGRGRGRGRGGGNEKFINGVDMSDQNRLFNNEEWENLPGWERREMQ